MLFTGLWRQSFCIRDSNVIIQWHKNNIEVNRLRLCWLDISRSRRMTPMWRARRSGSGALAAWTSRALGRARTPRITVITVSCGRVFRWLFFWKWWLSSYVYFTWNLIKLRWIRGVEKNVHVFAINRQLCDIHATILCSLVRLNVRLFICSFIHAFVHIPFVLPFVGPLTRRLRLTILLLVCSFIYAFVQSPIVHSFVRSFSRLFVHT